jgi:uncharacterized integral membrane protein
MRYLRYLFLSVIGILLITLALANRQIVSLRLLPGEMAEAVSMSGELRLPLFLVIFAGIVVGLLIGFVWEYLREHKHRRALSKTGREVHKLEREVKRLKGKPGDGKDDVLALLE